MGRISLCRRLESDGLLAVHLALHWKWIACVVKGQPTRASGRRLAMGAFGLIAVLALTAIPLVSSTRTTTRRELLSINLPAAGAAAESERHEASDASTAWLRGSLTFQEVAQTSGRSVSWLVEQLDLPARTMPSDRVGPVLRANGMRLGDLRRLLSSPEEPST
jgi:hypothetical protein